VVVSVVVGGRGAHGVEGGREGGASNRGLVGIGQSCVAQHVDPRPDATVYSVDKCCAGLGCEDGADSTSGGGSALVA
jgi:hypothetical protein